MPESTLFVLLESTSKGIEETRKLILETYAYCVAPVAEKLADTERPATLVLKKGESRSGVLRTKEELDRAERRMNCLVQFYGQQVRLLEMLAHPSRSRHGDG